MDAMGTLLPGPVPNDRSKTNQGRFVVHLLCFFNRVGDCLQICVTLLDGKDLPAVCEETLLDILSKCTGSIAVDCDICTSLDFRHRIKG